MHSFRQGGILAGYQVLGIRSFYDEKTRKQKKYDAFFEMRWRFDDISEAFTDPIGILDRNKVPQSERYNLYYTVCLSGDSKREFLRGEILPFDLDGIDTERYGEYIEPVIKVLGLDSAKTVVVFSGNGLHFIVKLLEPITEKKFYDERRGQYKAICTRINRELERLRLPGKADSAVFDPARILRLPGTINRKPDKNDVAKLIDREARTLSGTLVAQAFDFDAISEQPRLNAENAVPPGEFKKYARHSGEEAMQQCLFLKHVQDDAAKIGEGEWYAAASIVGRFEKGRELFHDISRGHRSYKMSETDEKLDQAIAASGPRTCRNINSIWGGCKDCPLYEKITSPIQIMSEDAIPTETTGFYDVYTTEEGKVKRTPNYGDLLKAFERDNPFFIDQTTGRLYAYNGKKYVVHDAGWLGAWCESKMEPKPTQRMRGEFAAKVFANNYKSREESEQFFKKTVLGKVNLFNGVYDLSTGNLLEHSPEYGFTYVLPYDYEPRSLATTFESFLADITMGRKELQETLLDFMAYAFVNDYPDHCFLWLSGTGRNGKSTLTDLMRLIVGKENCTNVMLDGFEERFQIETMNGALLNIGEETDSKKIPAKQLSMLKGLSAGAPTLVEAKGERPYTMSSTAKLVFMANDPPRMGTANQALKSRLLLVPFDKQLEGDDFCIIDNTLPGRLAGELPGIFNLLTSRLRGKMAKGPYRVHRNAVSKEAMGELLREGDSLHAWLEDYCVVEEGAQIFTKDAYEHYCSIVQEKYAGSKEGFGRRVCNLKPGKITTKVVRHPATKLLERAFTGLRFRDGIASSLPRGSDF